MKRCTKTIDKLQCLICMPPKPMNGHAVLWGVMVHTRTDCPSNIIYMVNDEIFNLPKRKGSRKEKK